METFLWCLLAIVGWFGFLAVLFWLPGGDCPKTTSCPHCLGRGYTLDKPLAQNKKQYREYIKLLSKGYTGTK